MNWIQVLLIASIVVLLVYLLRSRRSAQSRAWVKLGYVLFVVAAIYAIVRPNDTTVVANWLGVDRGTDLLEYALIVAFLFTTISAYMRFKDLELRYAQLARAVALEGARTPGGRSALTEVVDGAWRRLPRGSPSATSRAPPRRGCCPDTIASLRRGAADATPARRVHPQRQRSPNVVDAPRFRRRCRR